MQALFGLNVMKEAGEADGGGGAVDRGDEYIPTGSVDNEDDTDDGAEAAAAGAVAAAEADAKAEEEASKAAAEEEAKARDDKGRFIPKSRFDEQVRKEREARENAERQLAALQAQLKQEKRAVNTGELETEIKALEKSYTKLILQGDEDKASEIMSQIRLKERTVAIQEATNLSAQAKDQAREEIRVDTTIERIEQLYPELREGSDEYDQDIVDLVLAAQNANISDKRMSPSMALAKAAETVMSKIKPKAAEDEPEAKKGLGAAAGAADRKTAQVKKNLETQKRQPADVKDVGKDSDAAGIKGNIDVSKLSYADFEALPASTKARLRGDMLS